MSLKSFSFSSYKKFRDENKVELRPVTILVGKNSSGKSSVCKLLPMLAKCMIPYHNITPFLFDNDGVCLGTSFSDISHNGEAVGLCFGLEYSDGVEIKTSLLSEDLNQRIIVDKYVLSKNNEEYVLSYDRANKIYNANFQREPIESPLMGFICNDINEIAGVEGDLLAFDVDYIGPFRILPQRTYYAKGVEMQQRVGVLGENAYNELISFYDTEEAVSDWYEQNFGAMLSVDEIEGEKGAYHINLINSLSGNIVNIVDEGQGMSQVLPIVVRCNMKWPDSIVVIEQPELHLHPKAHASLGKLFATTSKKNNQSYLVETHSENLLLGLRDAVVDSAIDFAPEDVIIYFVDEDEDGSAYLRPITIDEDGMLSDWPTGVFNESYELLSLIKKKAYENKQKES